MKPLVERMKTEVKPALVKVLGLKNVMAAPGFTAIKVNVGIGTLSKTTKDFSDVISNVAKITGQKPVITKSKKAISNFKLREGVPAGITVTLRGSKMYSFLDRLVNVVLPRVRDFRGVSLRSFDGCGNYSIGFREATVFPEINPDDVLNVHGMQVTIITTACNDEQGRALLEHIGFPFRKDQ